MRIFQPEENLIERPPCIKCGTQMLLTRIEPDKPDHDRRTFECPECAFKKASSSNTVRLLKPMAVDGCHWQAVQSRAARLILAFDLSLRLVAGTDWALGGLLMPGSFFCAPQPT